MTQTRDQYISEFERENSMKFYLKITHDFRLKNFQSKMILKILNYFRHDLERSFSLNNYQNYTENLRSICMREKVTTVFQGRAVLIF
jgi:hypothetical protein